MAPSVGMSLVHTTLRETLLSRRPEHFHGSCFIFDHVFLVIRRLPPLLSTHPHLLQRKPHIKRLSLFSSVPTYSDSDYTPAAFPSRNTFRHRIHGLPARYLFPSSHLHASSTHTVWLLMPTLRRRTYKWGSIARGRPMSLG